VESALISSTTAVKHLIDHFIRSLLGDPIGLNPVLWRPFRTTPPRDAAAVDTGFRNGVAGLSQRAVFVTQVNELWAEILPTAEKRLRLEKNKTLG
jgi:hypothetical protein